MKWGSCDFKQLKRLQQRLERLEKLNLDKFYQQCCKELAARLLAKVIKRTPVGQYSAGSGKTGGTLRRGWTSKSAGAAASGAAKGAGAWANSLKITHRGGEYVIEIVNPVEYASYVEYGHRTANHSGWVSGRFMMTMSENELQAQAQGVVEKKLLKYMQEVFNGK